MANKKKKPINQKKKRNLNAAADRTYDYLVDHRKVVLRYVLLAAVTGILQLLGLRLLPLSGYGILLPFILRIALMFIFLKLWVYKERGTDGFYIARQIMMAIMLFTVATLVLYSLISSVGSALSAPVLVNYIGQGLLEILYFILFHFIIFKDSKNG